MVRRPIAAAAIGALILAACGGGDDAAPTTTVPPAPTTAAPTTPLAPITTPSTTSASATGQPVGFERTAATVTTAEGEVCELCLWRAATTNQRAQGLMGVTDLGAADGMVFVYGAETTGQFWMRDTVLPLSIAFFAADGALVSTTDMVPCLDGPDAACPRYAATGPYTAAIEVPAGGLADLGVAPGSRLDLLDTPCP